MTKSDVIATGAGVVGATWLGIGDLNAALALGVASLTICLLLSDIAHGRPALENLACL